MILYYLIRMSIHKNKILNLFLGEMYLIKKEVWYNRRMLLKEDVIYGGVKIL